MQAVQNALETTSKPAGATAEASSDRVYLTGVQALVRLPIEQIRRDAAAGLKTKGFISGYPGSPLGGYDIALSRAPLKENGVLHVPGQNEELAATALMGTQMLDRVEPDGIDGVIAMWYGKGPGVDRSGDAIKHGNFAGTSRHGAVVILSGEDHEAKSSSVPYQQEFAFEHAGVPVLYPSTVAEFLEYGFQAVALSRFSGCWVALKVVAPLCDGGEVVDLAALHSPVVPENFEIEGQPFRKSTDFNFFPVLNVGTEAKLYNERHEAALEFARVNKLNRVFNAPASPRIGIISAGKSFADVREALAVLGLENGEAAGIRLAKIGMLCPLDESFFQSFAEGLDLVIVVEEKRDFLERQVAKALAGRSMAHIIGKKDLEGKRLFPVEGGMDVDMVAGRLRRVLEPVLNMPVVKPVNTLVPALNTPGNPVAKKFPGRTPNYCSGCPHNVSTKLAEGQTAWGAPGCHVFAAVMEQPERRIEAMTQFGGEGLPWIGLSPFTTKKHMIQNVGDGSFWHSSHQNIRFAVATKQRMTFRILYNGVIANTGGQAYASQNNVVQLCKRLELDGVVRIALATKEPSNYRGLLPGLVALVEPHDIPGIMKELEAVDGVTVLIYDGACANERRRQQKRGKAPKPTTFTVVNEDVCENCGDCGRKANCMSLQKVETPFGLKTQIHQSSCNQDQACVEGDCPSFITVKVKEGGGVTKKQLPALPDIFPEPTCTVELEKPFSIYLPGVGGTGVISVNAMLAQAALNDGLNVKTYDQTGAAQKWGAVLSSLIVASASTEIIGNKVPARSADLYLALDMVAGAEAANLAVCSPQRTRAAVSSDTLPTGEMVRNVFFKQDKAGMLGSISEHVREDGFLVTPALTIAERLFGNYILSNMVMIGAALQAGFLPISAASVEKAIVDSGTAPKLNVLAFRAGRLSVADPQAMDALLKQGELTLADRTHDAEQRVGRTALEQVDAVMRTLPTALTASQVLVAETRVRVLDLIQYQGKALAARYARVLGALAVAEERAAGGAMSLTPTAIRNLHKILAYKDEYEVARLLTDPIFADRLNRSFDGLVGYSFNLQPPTMRLFGRKRKIRFGSWLRPVLKTLSVMRVLRGTVLDPFGSNPARKAEREAINWYEGLLEQTANRLRPDNHDVALEIVSLPEDIRGYEELKIRSIEAAREKAKALLAKL